MSRVQSMNDHEVYFVTLTVVEWADVFTRPSHVNILLEAFRYCQSEKGLVIFGYVIMSNHLHAILMSRHATNTLSDIIRDFKKFTSKRIIEQIKIQPESRRDWLLYLFERAGKYNPNNTQYQFWQQDNHPVVITSEKFARQKLDYIHLNPVRAGFVRNAADWQYSSAAAYIGEDDNPLLNINFLTLQSIWRTI
jgi:putative transposase